MRDAQPLAADLHSTPLNDSVSDSSGREIKRLFTRKGVSPYQSVKWEKRKVAITDDSGNVIFEANDIECPKSWSQTAINVVASKYFRGGKGTKDREKSVRSLISRVTDTISQWGVKDGYFKDKDSAEAFHDELTYLLLNQYAAFNSPVWFNVGVEKHPQCSACFIVSVDDTLDSLLKLQETEAKLFKYGSGTGSNLSSIRSSREKLKGGGVPSGPVSFMRGYDAWAGIIKSGGKTRRAAKMQILNATHPDIVEFIECKQKEEKKAWALIEQGYDAGFSVEGGAYDSVSFQNANLSVRVTDEFMRAAERGAEYSTIEVTTGKPCETLNARDVLRKIAEGTYICGDPGLQFDTAINDWHTCPNSGRINASNPCSEYMHVDNSACNLASLNLLKFFTEEGEFQLDKYLHAVDIMLTAQDILIDNARYPTEEIGKNSHRFRQLGLGYANLGATLMCLGVPYDSDAGREWAAVLTALMTGQAYKTSAELASTLGTFEEYSKNKEAMLTVMKKHRSHAEKLKSGSVPADLVEAAQATWNEVIALGEKFGYRNSQTTVLAPTGTISFMMDCDTTGIEPDIALVKYKKLSDGGMLKLVNHSVERALRALNYSSEAIAEIVDYIDKNGTIEGAPQLEDQHLPVFDCAFKPANGTRCIGYEGHLKMMAATQPFISGAISKTVNLPKETTVDQIMDIYLSAWKMGLKAVALYRDGSKRTQPLATGKDAKGTTMAPVRRHLPDERQAITHKFSVGGLEGYITVGLYEDGRPGEIFLLVAKEGSTLSGIMDAFATAISIALQYGVPLKALVRKFSHMRFEPSGFTGNPELPMAKSIIDYVFRWLGLKFLTPEDRAELGLGEARNSKPDGNEEKTLTVEKAAETAAQTSHNGKNGHALKPKNGKANINLLASTFQNSEDAPPCTNCGSSLMVRQAGCYVCLNCGAQGGCG
ncbi:MAG: vitamin B12-dependent ribonucleotide reductase [Candidatus Dadabacteria bacterium]|nr:MAG: vitamin B12-dependent ribonucleotide reductase [Candidatus Dadabacteria bacterium]